MDVPRLVPGISLVLLLTAANRSVAQVTATTLLPCCSIESIDPGAGMLVLKNSASGERRSVQTPPTNYRVGQLVDLNTPGTAMALPRFPVKYDKNNPKMHQNESWKMHSWVTLTTEGRIGATTRIESSSVQQGFAGGVEVLLLDRYYNLLHQTSLRKYAVNANSSRTVDWDETASPAAVNKVRAIVIHHSYEPQVRLAAGVEWLKTNSKNVSVVLACTPLANDGGGRRGARTPSLKPPSPSSIRCS